MTTRLWIGGTTVCFRGSDRIICRLFPKPVRRIRLVLCNMPRLCGDHLVDPGDGHLVRRYGSDVADALGRSGSGARSAR
jgi:hypothetical protein